jgi:beta-N-acetylhexosaminidase
MWERINVLVSTGLMVAMMLLLLPVPVTAQAEDDFIQEIIPRMSVEERIGQLFVVTFADSDIGSDSDIAQLISQYRVGGVVLLSSNGNFSNQGDTPLQVAQLTNGLQQLAHTAAQQATPGPSPYVPLLIALDHEGDGYPYTRLTNGFTALPNNMALGATWDEANAQAVGQIAGRELSAVGVNMLLGPSLDVLSNPRPTLKGDLGTRVFGGDPYWVGKMGQAYIRGVHEGSEGRVATVAKHFPGHGDIDRRADEEVSTVPKSLQELRKIELPPFFTVTDLGSPKPAAITDAMMSSHTRYRGFQGNISQLTPPISFAAELQAILSLPEFEPWRQAGGIMVTDALGVPAVRKYYDPQLQSFPHKRVAQEAFLAGNDLLVLSQFALTDAWADQFENIKSTIQFFRDKYVSDSRFQTQVDQSLVRILCLKHKLHAEFSLEGVQVDVDQLAENVGQGYGQVSQVAEDAITLIYPGPGELADRLPSPPLLGEKVLIFTDDRQAKDCYDCAPFYFIEPDALEKTILRLYGPEASGQIEPGQVRSLAFSQLKGYLSSAVPAGTPEDIAPLIQEADWIVFAMLDVNLDDYPDSDAVKLFLKQLSDSLRNKNIVVLAYNAPYYLDTTEISKLTAYYGIYSKVPAFIDASVRALFREFTLQGAPPVTVQGINYDLILQMESDPDQVIEIMPANAFMEGIPTEETSGSTGIKVGDTLELQAGIIKDRNGHAVPDGTPVVFRFFYPAETLELPRLETTTVNGIAGAAIKLERTGQLEISATSGPAFKSITLIVAIEGDEPAMIATLVPIPTPTPQTRIVPPTVTLPFLGSVSQTALYGGSTVGLLLLGLSYVAIAHWQANRRTRQAIERRFNPYKAGGPVEVKMFFGREEALAKVLDTIHNNHVAIYGERRIGKTSLLHQLDNRLRQVEDPQYLFIPAFVNLQGVPAERLFYTLMSAIARSCQPRIGSLDLVWATRKEGYDAYDLVDDLETVLEALEATTDKQIRLVLLLDEGDELNKYDPRVQARLRGVFMTRAGRYMRMVWSGLSIDREWKLDTSPWYNLFAIEIRLAPFTREEAVRLIQEPVKGIYRYDKDAIELILQYSERKPFRIQQICLATINRVLAHKRRRVTGPVQVTKEDVERAYRGLAAEEAISREVEERGKVGLLEKQVAEGQAEYQVNTDGQGDQ